MFLFGDELIDVPLNGFAVTPVRRMEAVSGATLSVDQELLKVPRDVGHFDRIVHELVRFSDLRHRLRARVLEELVEGVLVGAIHFELSINVQISVRLPVVPRAHMLNSIHDFVVFGWLLEIELVAREADDRELLPVLAILLDQRVEVQVLLRVGTKRRDVDD